MTSPSEFEQLQLELINRFRMSPQDEFALLVGDGLGATPAIEYALDYFGVDLDALQQQLSTLTAAGALAWNAGLAEAAASHSAVMIDADLQTHQAPGEASLRTRTENAGYTSQSYLGENVYAYTEGALHGHAGFVIDWGFDAGESADNDFASTGDGIQDPAGHRNTLISGHFTEIGISALTDSDPDTQVGPYVVTQDLGGRLDYNPQFVGVVADDIDGDAFYDIGEGLGGVAISLYNVDTGSVSNTTSWHSGGWQIEVPAGKYEITFSGGGLDSDVTRTATLGGGVNTKVDIYQPLDPLALTPDRVTLAEDGRAVFNPLSNDTGRGALELISVSSALHGRVSVGEDGRITYRPDGDYFGSDRFTYLVRDAAGRAGQAVVDVTVTPVNDGPIVGYAFAQTPEITVDAEAGSLVGINLTARDIDGEVSVFLSGEARQFFEVVSDAANTALYHVVVKAGAAFDFSTNPHISGTLTVADDGGLQISRGIVVAVRPGVPDEPEEPEQGGAEPDSGAGEGEGEGEGEPGEGGGEQPDAGGDGEEAGGPEEGGEAPGAGGGSVVVVPDDENNYDATDGSDIFALNSGGATVRGALSSLSGDQIEGFDFDDGVNIVGTRLGRSQFFFEADGTLYIDADGDGVVNPAVDARLSFGELSGGAFLSVRDAADTWIVYERLLPMLSEGTRVAAEAINGTSRAGFLSGNNSDSFSITIAPSESGFDNSLGVYERDAGGNILDVRIISTNVSMDAGAVLTISGVDVGSDLGFFLIQDGANRLDANILGSGALGIDTSAGYAVLTDGGRAVDGAEIFVSHDATLNIDGEQHVLSGASETRDGVLTIGFEDLIRTSGGASDDDFQDVIFDVAALDDGAVFDPLIL